ncbi:MAG: hypothetical protein AAF862_03865 [Pseudomonadota bacterium]
MRLWISILSLLALGCTAATAADLSLHVVNQKGVGMADAVVTFQPASDAAQSNSAAAPLIVNQTNNTFTPYMTVVPRGSQVQFRNDDSVLHHVFSFSAAKRFSLKLFGQSEPQTLQFDTAGIVVVGCNIHDDMIAYLNIVDTPYAAQTGPDGRVTLTGLPETPGELRVWHPLMKGRGNTYSQSIDPAAIARVVRIERKFRRGARPVGDY